MGAAALEAGREARAGGAEQGWTASGWTPRSPAAPVPPRTQPQTQAPAAPARCSASARDLLPLLEAAGLAVVLLDGAGRATTATPAVERLLGPDPERSQVWRAALALADTLRRAPARGAGPAGPSYCDVATALGTYRVAVLVLGAADGLAGTPSGWGAVTIVRVPSNSGDGWLRAVHALSRREQQVARLLADGRTTAEAAAALGISAHTARHHAERVYEKLGVRCRAALGRVLGAADAGPNG